VHAEVFLKEGPAVARAGPVKGWNGAEIDRPHRQGIRDRSTIWPSKTQTSAMPATDAGRGGAVTVKCDAAGTRVAHARLGRLDKGGHTAPTP
jgi:hypothetical protein